MISLQHNLQVRAQCFLRDLARPPFPEQSPPKRLHKTTKRLSSLQSTILKRKYKQYNIDVIILKISINITTNQKRRKKESLEIEVSQY